MDDDHDISQDGNNRHLILVDIDMKILQKIYIDNLHDLIYTHISVYIYMFTPNTAQNCTEKTSFIHVIQHRSISARSYLFWTRARQNRLKYVHSYFIFVCDNIHMPVHSDKENCIQLI